MPIQPINYAAIPTLRGPFQGIDFGDLLRQGMQLRHEPQRLLQERQQAELSNRLGQQKYQFNEAELPFAPQKAQADIDYRMAQTQLAKQQAENPLLNQLTGIAKEAEGLEYLRRHHGENSQVYRDARRRYEADLQQSNVLNQYRQALSGTADKRASTTLGKTEMEIADVMNRKDLSPQEKNSMIGRYELSRQKQISDSDSRKRALFASNVDKTLENINPKDLVQYGGIKGQAKLQADKLKAGLGKAPKDYVKYQDALTGAKLLAKQIRQFYGDSITPQVQEQLAEMVNPATWANNPDVALRKFDRFKNILQSETGTYRSALKETKEFNEDTQKERNMELLKKQRAMAEALKSQQPKTIGESSPIKKLKYVNGKIVNA